jgi:hypothetical protein
VWQSDVYRTFVYWGIWFGYTLLHMLFFHRHAKQKGWENKLVANYRKNQLGNDKKKMNKSNPSREIPNASGPFILIKRRFVMTFFLCFIKVKRKNKRVYLAD